VLVEEEKEEELYSPTQKIQWQAASKGGSP